MGVTVDVNALARSMSDLKALAPAAIVPDEPVTACISDIYDEHQRELFTFALRTCRDREAAEDLLQESFVRLIVEADAGRMPTNPRAWLYRVIANLAISRGRRATTAQRQLGALAVGEADEGPEAELIERERRSDLDAVLGELGVDARTALVLAANGFNGLEIAEAIGRTGNATRTLMCRARLQLRERLGTPGGIA
jgi:RNA polymerase sigma-70 factor (ECF subfamily)